MGDYSTSIIIVLMFALGIFFYAQTKFKNKMLCYFLRPNKTRLKRFVPMYYRHVELDLGKYGRERYRIDPNCAILEKYEGGVNKFFPVWVYTLEYKWDSPNPIDPRTSQSSWHDPQVEAAGYQGFGYTAFAKAAVQQAGVKRNKIMELIPIIVLGVLIIACFVGYQYLDSLGAQISSLQQQLNLAQ